jgi:hypothetical protein
MGAQACLGDDALTETGIFGRLDHKEKAMSARDFELQEDGTLEIARRYGTIVIKASEPTLLERYRADPAAVRAEIERNACRQRAHAMHAFFARLFA